jgi:hypothetical protein
MNTLDDDSFWKDHPFSPPPRPRRPDGTPGLRDEDAPCTFFDPGETVPTNTCMTDGHYLCQECRHRKVTDSEHDA